MDISAQEAEDIKVYKKSQLKLPDAETLAGLWAPDFDLESYPNMDKFDALSLYLNELEPYTKILTNASKLRQYHYIRWIQKSEDRVEDDGHKYWREGMNAISKDATEKLIYWKDIHDKMLTKIIKDFEKRRLKSPCDITIKNIDYESLKEKKSSGASKWKSVSKPRLSQKEKARRKKETKRLRAKKAEAMEKLLDDTIKDVRKLVYASVDKELGHIILDANSILDVFDEDERYIVAHTDLYHDESYMRHATYKFPVTDINSMDRLCVKFIAYFTSKPDVRNFDPPMDGINLVVYDPKRRDYDAYNTNAFFRDIMSQHIFKWLSELTLDNYMHILECWWVDVMIGYHLKCMNKDEIYYRFDKELNYCRDGMSNEEFKTYKIVLKYVLASKTSYDYMIKVYKLLTIKDLPLDNVRIMIAHEKKMGYDYFKLPNRFKFKIGAREYTSHASDRYSILFSTTSRILKDCLAGRLSNY